MPTTSQPPSPEPLRAKLSDADDRIRLNHWMPPQQGIFPRIRMGSRWINTLWALPIGAAALLCLIALAQSLRELPSVMAFIQSHPGIAQSAPSVDSGFPWWLQLQHFLNMFFMLFIMRAGLQILADHPRLYWGRDCTPGTDWFRFQVPVPKGRIWTAKDDVALHVRVIALENLLISLLATASDQQLELAREMAGYISPRPGFTHHPLTIPAAAHMIDLIERSSRFR